MKKRILDTCDFFGMLPYYKVFSAGGIEALEEYIESLEEVLDWTRHEMLQLYSEAYKEIKSKDFDSATDMLKDFYDEKLENKLKRLNINSLKTQFLIYFRKKRKKKREEDVKIIYNSKISEIERERCLAGFEALVEEIRVLIEKSDTLIKENDKIPTLVEDYKNLKNSIENGKLLLGAIKGEYQFFVCATGFDEILSHTEENCDNQEHWKIVDDQLVDGMMREFVTLLSTHSSKVLADIETVAKKLREPEKDGEHKAMKDDVNSNGVYGDSLIRAWSIVSGIPLITQNIKDYISTSNKQNDGLRRKKIAKIIANDEELAGIATDALVYSSTEVLAGEDKEPQKESPKYCLGDEIDARHEYRLPKKQGEYHTKAILIDEKK